MIPTILRDTQGKDYTNREASIRLLKLNDDEYDDVYRVKKMHTIYSYNEMKLNIFAHHMKKEFHDTRVYTVHVQFNE